VHIGAHAVPLGVQVRVQNGGYEWALAADYAVRLEIAEEAERARWEAAVQAFCQVGWVLYEGADESGADEKWDEEFEDEDFEALERATLGSARAGPSELPVCNFPAPSAGTRAVGDDRGGVVAADEEKPIANPSAASGIAAGIDPPPPNSSKKTVRVLGKASSVVSEQAGKLACKIERKGSSIQAKKGEEYGRKLSQIEPVEVEEGTGKTRAATAGAVKGATGVGAGAMDTVSDKFQNVFAKVGKTVTSGTLGKTLRNAPDDSRRHAVLHFAVTTGDSFAKIEKSAAVAGTGVAGTYVEGETAVTAKKHGEQVAVAEKEVIGAGVDGVKMFNALRKVGPMGAYKGFRKGAMKGVLGEPVAPGIGNNDAPKSDE